jgi:hypothetical protein
MVLDAHGSVRGNGGDHLSANDGLDVDGAWHVRNSLRKRDIRGVVVNQKDGRFVKRVVV